MDDIKWNEECHNGPILQNYYTTQKKNVKLNLWFIKTRKVRYILC